MRVANVTAHKAKHDELQAAQKRKQEQQHVAAAERKLHANKDFMSSHVIRGATADKVNKEAIGGYVKAAASDAKERGRY